MCVSASSSQVFDRAQFFGLAAGAFAAATLAPTAALATPGEIDQLMGLEPARMSPGNQRAADIARTSPFARANFAGALALADSIADAAIRASIRELFYHPRPSFFSRYPDTASRTALRDTLARAGFVAADAPVTGIFPSGGGVDETATAPQPFWSTPGSGRGSHHAYPGGLVAHEFFNASMALEFAQTYDRMYFSGTRAVDRDIAIGAALYHDVMKSVVFQWHDDGTITDELTIAGTGAHHTLSGAEAIARGRSPRFVIALLSAHAAPSLGDEAKVVDWCRVASMLAGVDPVAYGLLRRTGTTYALATDFVPTEAFINHLSDHDYVLSVHAMHVVRAELDRLRARHAAKDEWFVNTVLSKTSAIALYQTLASGGGRDAFDRQVDRYFAEA